MQVGILVKNKSLNKNKMFIGIIFQRYQRVDSRGCGNNSSFTFYLSISLMFYKRLMVRSYFLQRICGGLYKRNNCIVVTNCDLHMYNRVVSVRARGLRAPFIINNSWQQGSILSHYLFALIMDERAKNIQDEVAWCMLFADVVQIVVEAKESWVQN